MTKHTTNALAPLELRIAVAAAALAYADAITETINAKFSSDADNIEAYALAAQAEVTTYSDLRELCSLLAAYS